MTGIGKWLLEEGWESSILNELVRAPNRPPSPGDSIALIPLELSCLRFSTPTASFKPFSLQNDLPKVQIWSSSQSSGWTGKFLNMAHKALHHLAYAYFLHPCQPSSPSWRMRVDVQAPHQDLHGLTFLLPVLPVLLLFIQPRPIFHIVLSLTITSPRENHRDQQHWLPCITTRPYLFYHLFYLLSHRILTVNLASCPTGVWNI